MKKLSFVGSAFALALLTSTVANSAIVHVGTGNTVDFYYDDADPGTLAYGTLQISGDTIYATPSTFEAIAVNGDGTSTFTNTGSVYVVAKSGYTFAGVDILEGGNYDTTGNGSVEVTSLLRVMESDNIFTQETNNLIITDLTAPGANNWEGTLSYDMTTGMWDSTNAFQ